MKRLVFLALSLRLWLACAALLFEVPVVMAQAHPGEGVVVIGAPCGTRCPVTASPASTYIGSFGQPIWPLRLLQQFEQLTFRGTQLTRNAQQRLSDPEMIRLAQSLPVPADGGRYALTINADLGLFAGAAKTQRLGRVRELSAFMQSMGYPMQIIMMVGEAE